MKMAIIKVTVCFSRLFICKDSKYETDTNGLSYKNGCCTYVSLPLRRIMPGSLNSMRQEWREIVMSFTMNLCQR
jgi:hypothetical protein